MSPSSAEPLSSASDDQGDRAGRRAWVAPDVRRLSAGEAEFNPTFTNDSEGTVS
jgi:hypothetical protein